MMHSQEQEKRLNQTPARRITSNFNKAKQNISKQNLNAREEDGRKKMSEHGEGYNKTVELDKSDKMMRETDITMSEMKQSIRNFKKKKSPGPDNITNEMLQHLGNSSFKYFAGHFNLSWRQGQVPQCWKDAIMMQILKKGKNKSKVSKLPSYKPNKQLFGEAEQDTAHLLQSCNLHQALRDKIWHSVTSKRSYTDQWIPNRRPPDLYNRTSIQV
ncbi:unnamed protein product [Mytilus edulis]|uniref:Uncharacterized protein n=1 Tax=Mytilus edulis TaxID=6550 RepID=A0A8S3QB05_MYTED|nr:unnamed protein product [Mytilus edulis]